MRPLTFRYNAFGGWISTVPWKSRSRNWLLSCILEGRIASQTVLHCESHGHSSSYRKCERSELDFESRLEYNKELKQMSPNLGSRFCISKNCRLSFTFTHSHIHTFTFVWDDYKYHAKHRCRILKVSIVLRFLYCLFQKLIINSYVTLSDRLVTKKYF